MNLKNLHNQILYTQVRVRTNTSGGSGTVIYSDKNILGEHSTYIISCHHVIDDVIKVKKEWDSKIGKEVKKEYRQLVSVEFFDYENKPHGLTPVTYSIQGEVVAYDVAHDMALIKLRTLVRAKRVAQIATIEDYQSLDIGSPTVAVGCALGHDPILTFGTITHMGDEIDYKRYDLSSANICFGNSGGAMFSEFDAGYKFIGVPSRVAIVGWGSPITYMGYYSPLPRIHEFLREQIYDFILPNIDKTEEECAKEREVLRKRMEKMSGLEEEEGVIYKREDFQH